MSETAILGSDMPGARPLDGHAFTIAEIFPELHQIVKGSRHPGRPLPFTVIPSSGKGEPNYTNEFIARFIDGVGIKTDKQKSAELHFADPDLTTIIIADGYQPQNQAQFDIVYCPEDAFRTGPASLPRTRQYPNGKYNMPSMIYLEPKAHITEVLNNTFGKEGWKLVPVAYESEQTKKPGIENQKMGFFTRCAVLVKK